MANHGAGNRFVSVNLNKSYGKLSGPGISSSYGGSRVRQGGQVGGGGGMVVLSRPRSSQKIGQKLSVPSPVNLPSMRKEHEKFDSSGAGSGSAGGAAGSSSRPSSAGMGWTKPAAIILQEKEKSSEASSDVVGGTLSSVDGASRGAGVYMPPARSGSTADVTGSAQAKVVSPVERVAILRGEDFPSLHTSLSTGSGQAHKQKDGPYQKSKQLSGEKLSGDHRDDITTGDVDVHPQGYTSQHSVGNELFGTDGGSERLGGPRSTEDARKQDNYIHVSLPEVRLNPRSDWADDERDTGHVLADRSRIHGSQKDEGYWDRDFDLPRGSVMPPKPAPNVFNKWGQRDGEAGKMTSSEVFKADPQSRDARPASKEGREHNSWNNSESHGRDGRDISSWRTSSASVIRAKPQGTLNSGNSFGAEPFNMKREMSDDNRFVAPLSHDRKNTSSMDGGRHRWNSTVEATGTQGADRVGGEQFQKFRSNNYQNGSPAKSNFSLGGKGLSVNDPILNFSKVKKPLLKSDDLSLEDPFTASGFDGRDLFSGGLMSVVKRKKDVPKLTEFHDSARESFEAELERVQKMQEQERQRAIEEQERAMERARREEEERFQLAREQEERQRRLEEEAREASWRAEQERLEAIRKAEELRVAREEEKQRMLMEEERSKQAAKQKLLELEEKIARRQAEATKKDTSYAGDGTSGPGKEKETSRAADLSDWEDGERMVERITTSASSDSSGLNRFVESGSRPHSFADNALLTGRGKSVNSWKRDAYENEGSSNFILHNHGNDHRSPGRDVSFHAKKSLPRKDVYGGSGFMYPYNYAKSGVLDTDVNDPFYQRGQRWKFPGERDHYDSNHEIDPEANESFTENLGNAGWGGNHHAHSIYRERPYQNPESGEVYSYSRSRYSVRQPRVLPPPTISSLNRTLNREVEKHGLSTSLDRVVDSNHVRDPTSRSGYDSARQEKLEDPEMVTFHPCHTAMRDQLLESNNSIRCDSQSSLSVTSPPSSPTHLSHEDLDDSRGTPDSSATADAKGMRPSSSDPVMRTGSFFTAVDDGEWFSESHENLQEQEVYDEGGEYQEGGEVHVEDEDIDLNEEFEALNIEEKDSPQVSENLILGFNEGVEVGMPSDESESSLNEKSRFSAPQSVDPMQGDDGLVGTRSATEMQMTEDLAGDLAVQSNVDPPTSLGSGEATFGSSQPLPAMAAPSPVSRPVPASMPAVPNCPEVPFKLQFGLFSGPSLIPSPVPSIQIGSIQMPLHLHPQGSLPMAPQTISFVQPSVPGPFANHSPIGPTLVQPLPDSSQSQNADNREALVKNEESFSQNNMGLDMNSNSLQVRGEEGRDVVKSIENDNRLGLDAKVDGHLEHVSAPSVPTSSAGGGHLQSRVVVPQHLSRERVMIRSKAPGPTISGGRGRENFSTGRSFGPRSSNVASASPHFETSGSYRKPQRNGHRGENPVQENAGRRFPEMDDKINFGPKGARTSSKNGSRRGAFLGKLAKQNNESDWKVSSPKDITSGRKDDKGIAEESSIVGHDISRAGEGRLKRNIEDGIDAPLQSGLVRVYEQPGIEVPSDEDDFIEVRSKRQMLNDRREQREKDMAKSRLTKNLRKPRPTQNARAPRNDNKTQLSLGRAPSNEGQSILIASEERSRVNAEISAGFNAISVSQPLAPIGTPSAHSDGRFDTRSRATKPVQESGVASTGGNSVGQELTYENKSNAIENVEVSLGPWNNAWVNQQVMPLTQSQLDDAMNPVRLDGHDSSSGNPTGSVGVPAPPSSNMLKDKSFSSAASPISSLLAGEKIQFGAVTSPTIIPPSSRAVSQGIGSLGSGRSDQVSHELDASKNVGPLFNENEKLPKEPSSHMELSESDAEAAASAVAVAAITADDVLGTVASHSFSGSEGFGRGTDDGTNNDQKSRGQSRTEESLSVSLPADLSIETPPISLWQPLQSPQNVSNHMLSHFSGGHPSHFPFFEMNPMVGGPVFAFGPHDDASGSQTQPQKNNSAVSGPLGPWQQPQSAADSYYGHPAGFTAPFIPQQGGIPGAPGPPHMVVYNHFAPVGQFGQVGLSFMGTTYIPSGKKPDWKHNPTSSAMSVGEENSAGMNSGQQHPHGMPTPIQNLVPGPSLLPMAPLAMFDVSPYHQASDMAGQARWSHVAPPHLHSMPPLLPLQPQPEGSFMHSQLNNGPLPDKSIAPSPGLIGRFPDPQTAAGNYPAPSGAPAPQFPTELGLVEPSGSAPFDPTAIKASSKSGDITTDAGTTGSSQSGGSSQNMNSGAVGLSHQMKHGHSTGYSYHRGGSSRQRNGTGSSNNNEWPHRRAGYHSKNQSSNTEKGFYPSKVKQIYVPKQPANSTSST
uniref:Uncharacterized protein n=1 Tax=Kalanchoe fedtschenkoi TaxID=63787 RepID=A0A7N0T9R3_KALFE